MISGGFVDPVTLGTAGLTIGKVASAALPVIGTGLGKIFGKGGGAKPQPSAKAPIPTMQVGQVGASAPVPPPQLEKPQLGQMSPQSFALEQLKRGGYT